MTLPSEGSELRRDVRTMLDREELRELQMRYSMAIDDRRIEDFGLCFTTAGEFGHVDGTVVGRAAIVEYQNERLALYGPTFHSPHEYSFVIDGDTATGVVLAHSELAIGGRMFQVAFRYRDTYQREDRWRFSSRHIHVLYFSPVDDLPGIFADRLRKRWPGPSRAADLPEGSASWEQFAGVSARATTSEEER